MTCRFRSTIRLAAVSVAFAATPVLAQDWQVDWWSLDSGTIHIAEGGDWTLSGTVGQADATTAHALSGGPWQITGGFWALRAPVTDYLFSSGFEG